MILMSANISGLAHNHLTKMIYYFNVCGDSFLLSVIIPQILSALILWQKGLFQLTISPESGV